MKVLLSIKPEYVEKIFDGSKKFEFRKIVFKNKNITSVVVYASHPVQKVVGEFLIEEILEAKPSSIWSKTKQYSGIRKSFFDEYFEGKNKAYAIKIKSVYKYQKPKCLKKHYNISYPPQSFMYVS